MSDGVLFETPEERIARLRREREEALRKLPPGAQLQPQGEELQAKIDALLAVLRELLPGFREAIEEQYPRALADVIEATNVQLRHVATEIARQQLMTPPAHMQVPVDLRGGR